MTKQVIFGMECINNYDFSDIFLDVCPFIAWYKLHIYIQGPDPGIEFLVDDFSLQEIPENTNWKTEANQRIENIRKTNFSLR